MLFSLTRSNELEIVPSFLIKSRNDSSTTCNKKNTYVNIKTQACLISIKRSRIHLSPTFRCVSLLLTDSLQLLGVELSSNLNFGQYIESKAPKLWILSKVRRYFTPKQLFQLYQAQVRSCMGTAATFGMVPPNTNWQLWNRLKSESRGSSVILLW